MYMVLGIHFIEQHFFVISSFSPKKTSTSIKTSKNDDCDTLRKVMLSLLKTYGGDLIGDVVAKLNDDCCCCCCGFIGVICCVVFVQ